MAGTPNVGTLVGAAIRPINTADLISTAYANEIKGGIHGYETLTERNGIIIERRQWGMLAVVYNDSTNNKTYQLKYNNVDTDLMNNLNWVEYTGASSTNISEWQNSVKSILTAVPTSPSDGDRYLVGLNQNSTVTGAPWAGNSGGFISQYNLATTTWTNTLPTNGMTVRVDDQYNSLYKYEGDYFTGQWVKEKLTQVHYVDFIGNGVLYTTTISPTFSVYDADAIFLSKFNVSNTGIVSVNINGVGIKMVKKPSSNGLVDLTPNDIIPENIYSLSYDFGNDCFQFIKTYSNDSFNIKYYIEPNDYIVVPPYCQYWVYGDLTVDGTILNYGKVIVANGELIIGTFGVVENYGDVDLITIGGGNSNVDFSAIDGHLIPSVGDTYDIGATAGYNWRDLYLSGTTIYLGDSTISSVGGQVLFNGSSTIGVTGPAGQDGITGGQLYYFNESEAGYTASYRQLGNQPIITTEEVVTKTLAPTESNVLVSSYISDSLGLVVVPAGVQRFSLHYKKDASSSNISTYAVIQLANQAGDKYYDLGATQAIAYSNIQEIGWANSNTVNISLDIISATTEILATDRIVVSLYVNNLDSVTQSVSFYTEGTNNYSYIQTSTAVVPGPQGPIGATGSVGPTGATGDKYSTTSSSTFSIPGLSFSRDFVIGTGLAYTPSQTIIVSPDINSNDHFHGTINSYYPLTGSMSVTCTDINGSVGVTYSSWTINLSGAVGVAGPTYVNLRFTHATINPVSNTGYNIGVFPQIQPYTNLTSNKGVYLSQYTGRITDVSIVSDYTGGSTESSTFRIFNITQATSSLITNTIKYATSVLSTTTIINEPLINLILPAGWSVGTNITFVSGYVKFGDPLPTLPLQSTLDVVTINGSTYDSISVTCDVARFGTGAEGPMTIQYSLDGGLNWITAGNTINTTGTTYVTSTVSFASGNGPSSFTSNMKIRFYATVTPGNSSKRLRNVVISGITNTALVFNNYTLASELPVSVGDYLNIRWSTPSWVTAPTSITNVLNAKLKLL
jgi:hypothetical protein